MRLSTLLFAIMVIAVVLAIVRDETGRVAVIVFATGVGFFVSALTAIMALFQTIGAFGAAQTLGHHLEAVFATIVVLIVGSAVMLGVLFGGIQLVMWSLP